MTTVKNKQNKTKPYSLFLDNLLLMFYHICFIVLSFPGYIVFFFFFWTSPITSKCVSVSSKAKDTPIHYHHTLLPISKLTLTTLLLNSEVPLKVLKVPYQSLFNHSGPATHSKIYIGKRQDGGGVGGHGIHLSPWMHQEYVFRHGRSQNTS